jgi:hypothetical protein
MEGTKQCTITPFSARTPSPTNQTPKTAIMMSSTEPEWESFVPLIALMAAWSTARRKAALAGTKREESHASSRFEWDQKPDQLARPIACQIPARINRK